MKNKKLFATLLSLAGVLILSAGTWLFLFYLLNLERNKIKELRKVISVNEEKIANSEFLNNLVEETKKDKLAIDGVFLTDKELIRVIEGLESIAGSSGAVLKISSVSPGALKNAKPAFSFSAEGNFNQVFGYLNSLENLPYYLNINMVGFHKVEESKKDTAARWQAVFNIELESYEKI